MTREEMLALLERRVSHWQDRDPEAIAADYAETAVLDSPMTGHSVGREAIRRAYERLLKAFGELSIAYEDVLVDGDRMVAIFTFTGRTPGRCSVWTGPASSSSFGASPSTRSQAARSFASSASSISPGSS